MPEAPVRRAAGLAERIAAFCGDLRYEQVPASVIAKAKHHLLDALGIALAASASHDARRLEGAVRAIGGGAESTVIGFGKPLGAAWATLLNGALIHSLEYDDTHTASVIHGSSVVVPAALASAERERRSGRELLTAIVAGWEALIRLGAAAPGALQARGFQTTAVCGPFVSAAIASRLMGLSLARTVDAIGIAGSQASGVFAFLDEGSTVKALHPGWAAHAGFVAAHLSAGGMTGPSTIFESKHGFYSAYGGTGAAAARLAQEAATLGSVWRLSEAALKLYPCCHYIHSFLECVERIRSDSALAAEDIESVECWVPVEEAPIICDPWERRLAPKTGYEAKFSLPYCIAVLLTEGRVDVATFDTDALPVAALALAGRISYTPIDNGGFPARFPGRVRIRLRSRPDALELSVDDVRGSPARPASPDEVIAKFRSNALRRISPAAADRVVERVMDLEELTTVDRLSRDLRDVPGADSGSRE